MSRITPLYKKDDTVYCICKGVIMPVCINDVYFNEGIFSYSINYHKYLTFCNAAKAAGFELNIPKTDKTYKILQEDMFGSLLNLLKDY